MTDEATSGLDPGTEGQLMRLLRHLADDGHTVVLITHATKNVMLCDKVAFLAKGGYLAFYGPPEQALAHFGVEDFDNHHKASDDYETMTHGFYVRAVETMVRAVKEFDSRLDEVAKASGRKGPGRP